MIAKDTVRADRLISERRERMAPVTPDELRQSFMDSERNALCDGWGDRGAEIAALFRLACSRVADEVCDNCAAPLTANEVNYGIGARCYGCEFADRTRRYPDPC